MSTEIEERVVQMRFDSKNFDRNIEETIRSLNQFESKLKLLGAQQGLENVQKAADDLDFAPMIAATTKVESRFNAMSIACITVITRMTNKIIDSAEKMVRSLTFDQVEQGWSKYADKTSAVQTIMAATAKNFSDTGEQMEYVNGQLEKLNWFTDETSYKFLDMVNNIGKFTSNNIALDTSVTAMQGIANWAAISGANANEASRAMYNLAQSMSKGYMQLIDWRSIENANMSTVEFKETVIQTALAVGTLEKTSKEGLYHVKGAADDATVSVENFSEQMAKGWFSSDVILQSLDKYGKFSTALYEVQEAFGGTASEWLDWTDAYASGTFDIAEAVQATGKDAGQLEIVLKELSGAEFELSRRAFRAGQETKTFAEAVDYVKEAVSTGWMNTFEHIFGDYAQAKKLWTGLANELYEVFVAQGEARNAIFEEWSSMETGGREDLIAGVAQAYYNLKDVVMAVKEAISEMFPPLTAEKLANIVAGFKDFTEKTKLSTEALTTLKIAVKLLLIPLRLAWELLRVGATWLRVIAVYGIKAADAFLSMFMGVNKLEPVLRKLFGDDRYDRFAKAISALGSNLKNAFSGVAETWNNSFGKIKISDKLLSALQKIGDLLAPLAGWLLDRVIEGIEVLANTDYSKIGDFVNNSLKNMVSHLQAMGGLFTKAGNALEAFFNKIRNSSPADALNAINDTWLKIQNFPAQIRSLLSMNTLYTSMGNSLDGLSGSFAKLGDSIVAMMNRLTPSKILIFAFGTAVTGTLLNIMNVANLFTNVAKTFENTLKSLQGVFKALGEKIRGAKIYQIAAAILGLAAAIGILSMVDTTKMWEATKALVLIMGVLSAMVALISVLERTKVMDAKNFARIATGISSMAISMSFLVAALMIMGTMDLTDIWKRLGVLVSIVVTLTAVSVALSKFASKGTKGFVGLISFALAVASLVNTLKVLITLAEDKRKLKTGINAMLEIIGMLSLVSLAIQGIKFTSGAGMILLAISILAAAKVFIKIAEMDLAAMNRGFQQMLGIIMTLVTITTLGSAFSKGNGTFSKSLIALGASLIGIALAVKILSGVDAGSLRAATNAVTQLIAIMGAVGTLMAGVAGKDKELKGIGKAFMSMAGSLLLISIAIAFLGALNLDTLAKGTAAVSVLLGLFALIVVAGRYSANAKGAIIAISVGIGLLTTALVLLTLIPVEELFTSAGALALVMGSLAATMYALSRTKGNWNMVAKRVVLMIAVLGSVYLAIKEINKLNLGSTIIRKVEAFSLLMTALAVAIGIMTAANGLAAKLQGKNGTAVGSIAVAVGEMVAIALATIGLLWALEGMTISDSIFEKLSAFENLFTYLGIATLAISAFIAIAGPALNPAVALPALVTVGIVLAAVAAVLLDIAEVALIIGAAANKWDWILPAMDAGTKFFTKLGELIGGFFGGMVGNFVDQTMVSYSDDLWQVADNLDKFMDHLQPFLEKVKGVPEEAKTGAANLIGVLGEIMKNNILQNLAEYFLGADNFKDFTWDLAMGAGNLSAFGTAMSTLGGDTLVGAKNVAEIVKILSEAMSLLNTGGLLSWFKDDNFAKFTVELNKGSDDLVAFGQKMKEIPDGMSSMRVLAAGIKDLMDAMPENPAETGLGDFAHELQVFSARLYTTAATLSTVIYDESVQNAMTLAKQLGELADQVPPRSDGLLGWLNSQQQLGDWGQQLSTFGGHMRDFAGKTRTIDASIITVAGYLASASTKLIDNIPPGSDWNRSVLNFSNLDNLSDNLETFADAIVKFYDRIKGVNFNYAGFDIVNGLATGIANVEAQTTLKVAAQNLGWSVIAETKKVLGIEGPTYSKKFNDIGQYVIQGFTKGLQNRSDLKNLNDAAIAMSKGVLRAVEEYNEINSPSALYKREVGVFIVQGIAEGIESDMSAEEAAKKKAENIATAFKNAFEYEMAQLDLHQAKYDLWGSMEGLVATDAEKRYQETLLYQDKLKVKGLELLAAQKAYETSVSQVGKDHVETIKLQTEMLQKQKEMNDLAKEFAEFNAEGKNLSGSKVSTSTDYYAYLNSDEVKKMLEGGISIDEIKKYAQDKFGYEPGNMVATGFGEGIEEGMNTSLDYYNYLASDAVKKMMEGGISKAEIEKYAQEKFGFTPGVKAAEAFTAGIATGFNNTDIAEIVNYFSAPDAQVQIVESAKKAGAGAGDGFNNGLDEELNKNNPTDYLTQWLGKGYEIIAGESEESGANIALGAINSLINLGREKADEVIGFGQGLIDNINIGSGVESPSWKTYETGKYVVEGLSNGIRDNAYLAADEASSLANLMLNAFSGIQEAEEGQTSAGWNNRFYESGANMLKIFAEGFKSAYDFLQLAYSEVTAKLLAAILETHPTWRNNGYDLGKIMMEGLVNAVEDGKSAAINAIVQAAVEAYQAALGALGVDPGSVSVGPSTGASTSSTMASKLDSVRPSTSTKVASTVATGIKANTSSKYAQTVATQSKNSLNPPVSVLEQMRDQWRAANQTTNYTYTFNQTNNSPKAISAADAYRAGNSGMAKFKAAIRGTGAKME